MAKPRLFVGCSQENLKIAYAIQENLEHDAETTVWTQGVFTPSVSSIEALSKIVPTFDAAVFVFSPDDVTTIRGTEVRTVRDNVILEVGMFIGRVGRERTFLVVPRDTRDLHLPTDLLGMTPVDYDPNRSDKNWNAALGAACNQIRKALTTAPSSADEQKEETVKLTDAEIIGILQSWIGGRDARLNKQPIYFTQTDNELNLPPGSTKKHIKTAAQKYYDVEQEGPTLILFKERPFRMESRTPRWRF